MDSFSFHDALTIQLQIVSDEFPADRVGMIYCVLLCDTEFPLLMGLLKLCFESRPHSSLNHGSAGDRGTAKRETAFSFAPRFSAPTGVHLAAQEFPSAFIPLLPPVRTRGVLGLSRGGCRLLSNSAEKGERSAPKYSFQLARRLQFSLYSIQLLVCTPEYCLDRPPAVCTRPWIKLTIIAMSGKYET